MVHVIERGILPPERIYRTTCWECGTIFEFAAREAKTHYGWDGDYVSIDCPICNQLVNASVEKFK